MSWTHFFSYTTGDKQRRRQTGFPRPTSSTVHKQSLDDIDLPVLKQRNS